MNVAAQIIEDDLAIYLEGLPLHKCLNSVGEEKADVSLLVFTDGRRSTSHYPTHTDAGLAFCQQRLPVHVIGQQINDTSLGQPTELEISSERFYLRQWFPGAYRLTFYHFKGDGLYQHFIARILPGRRGREFNELLMKEGKAATSRFVKEFDGLELDRFARRRFDRWHTHTVKEFEKGLADGTARCDGCDGPVTT